MRAACYVMLVLGMGLAVNLLAFKAIDAADVQNARCVTSLNPATCDSEGNSICNEAAGSEGECGGDCTYCPGDGAVPTKHCIDWEGSCCQTGGAGESECHVPDVEQLSGECGQQGSCVCTNPQPNGNDCGNTQAMESCTGNCS